LNGKNTIFVILAIIAHDSRLSVRLVTDNECHKLTTTYEYVCVYVPPENLGKKAAKR